MKLLTILLLVGIVSTGPTSNKKSVTKHILEIDEDFFDDSLVVYTGKHDIVNIYVPINGLNFNDEEDEQISLFFVEADVSNGNKDYKGLYLLRGRNATKLLDNGRDISANNDEATTVFIGAGDGIYTYNPQTNAAQKYGTVTDSVKSIAKENGTDVIYIVTDDKELYKVTEEGTKKEKMNDVTYAEEIVLDYSNNLYYYGADNKLYVVNAGGIKKIEGLPENPTNVRLLKPMFVYQDAVPFIVDDKVYVVFAKGNAELCDLHLKVKPTAYSTEAVLIQYYARNKKIYEYNILELVLGDLLEDFRNFISDKTETITSLAKQPRNRLRPDTGF